MELIRIEVPDADRIAPLVAAFRTQLKSYKGIKAQPDNPVSRYMRLKTAVPLWAILSAESTIHAYGSNRSLCGKIPEEKVLQQCFSARLKRSLRQWEKILFTTLSIRTTKK